MRLDRFERPEPSAAEPEDQAARNLRTRTAVARLARVRQRELRVLSHDRTPADGLRADVYTFGVGQEAVRGVVLAPAGTGPWPAVLVCQGRNATLERVTGLEPPDHPDRNVAVHLARAGHLTLTLDYGLADALDPAKLAGRDAAEALDGLYRAYGGSLLGALVERALAGFAWLAAHPDAAPGRIGLFGHSFGAAVALHTALLREDRPPVCTAAHLGGYPVMLGRSLAWNPYVALPGILRHADLADLYAALAPTPLQVQYGTADPHLPTDDAAGAGKRLQDGYAAVGAAGAAEVLPLPMGHGTGIAETVDFFGRALAEPRNPEPQVPAARAGFDVPSRLLIADLVDESLATGRLTLGPYGARLERLAARHVGRGAAAVASGSAAVEIALRVVGVEGRTVLVPANTFFATAASAIRAGARVGFVDMELDGLGMDPDALRAALDAHDDVAAVVPVHIAGVVSPALAEVRAECERRGVAVVEDAAHALGSALDGAPAGGFGRLAAFSFYPTKVITSGEGGLVAAGADDLDRVFRLRDHGKRSFHENVHADLGSNWRMGELHAAVGVTHLARLEEVLAERRRLAQWYDDNLSRVPGLTRYTVPGPCRSNHYKYVAYLPEGVDRAELKRHLRSRGVALAGEVYDVPLHRQPYFAEAFAGHTFPRAEWFADRHICLPLFPGMTTRQQERVVAELRKSLS